ncbi:hypothetical protein BM221_000788 [Beauveria bassiana]|uniref:Uncharacterized protein n=1 Tax=Beauveria bassiana TaxID=176275 RepID=A0A2N6P1H3_BEABA|nr:hypothetical protein BM221_000788 [Beauveria bassiana]
MRKGWDVPKYTASRRPRSACLRAGTPESVEAHRCTAPGRSSPAGVLFPPREAKLQRGVLRRWRGKALGAVNHALRHVGEEAADAERAVLGALAKTGEPLVDDDFDAVGAELRIVEFLGELGGGAVVRIGGGNGVEDADEGWV